MSYTHTSIDLQCEIDRLREELKASDSHIKRLNTKMAEMVNEHEFEGNKLKEELSQLHERYKRLVSNHQSLSKLNHNLEESLISTIETSNSEKTALSRELEVTRIRLKECESRLVTITEERNQYKEDCFTATALLRANPDQFLPQACSPATATAPRVSSSFLPTFPPVGLAMFHMDTDRTESQASTTSCRLASRDTKGSKSNGQVLDL